MSSEKNNQNTIENIPSQEQVQAIKTSEFMKETIKQRPINKRKLFRRLAITVSMALIFGLVACLTFLFLEPIIDKRLNPQPQEPEVRPVSFVEETLEEETKPEDMIAEEAELAPIIIEQTTLDDEQIEKVLSKYELGVDDYITLSTVITDVAKQVSMSMVNVLGITQDTDWLNNEFSSENSVSGVIVADNGRDLLILANIKNLKDYDMLRVDFTDGTDYDCEILAQDYITGMAVISVNKSIIKSSTLDNATIIQMGSSGNSTLIGTPIIALGTPYGQGSSIAIGHVTGVAAPIDLPDSNYKGLTTDIFGIKQASGFLVNIRGQLIGVIDQSYNLDGMENMINGIGITELKKLIEKLSNGKEIPYIGLYGTTVTEEISSSMNIPKGVYIRSLEMDSPFLEVGVQNGDIITKFGGVDINTIQDLNNMLLVLAPEDVEQIELMRQSPEGYSLLSIDVTLAYQKK